jgi:hypothetical protein
MEIIKVVTVLAALATALALAAGVRSMAVNHEVAHLDSLHWMIMRVVMQAAVFAMVVLSFYS